MIILMAGYPKSGKSEIAKVLYDNLDESNSHWYRVDDMVPKNIENVPDDVRSEIYLAAWEEIMDRLKSKIMSENYDTIILDLCNPINYSTASYFPIAKSKGQQIITIFSQRSKNDCIECANGSVEESAFDKYTDKFKDSLPKLKKLSNKFIKIDNNNDLPTLRSKAKKVRNKLCLNTSTKETMT